MSHALGRHETANSHLGTDKIGNPNLAEEEVAASEFEATKRDPRMPTSDRRCRHLGRSRSQNHPISPSRIPVNDPLSRYKRCITKPESDDRSSVAAPPVRYQSNATRRIALRASTPALEGTGQRRPATERPPEAINGTARSHGTRSPTGSVRPTAQPRSAESSRSTGFRRPLGSQYAAEAGRSDGPRAPTGNSYEHAVPREHDARHGSDRRREATTLGRMRLIHIGTRQERARPKNRTRRPTHIRRLRRLAHTRRRHRPTPTRRSSRRPVPTQRPSARAQNDRPNANSSPQNVRLSPRNVRLSPKSARLPREAASRRW